MYLYNLTLQRATGITHAVHGNFSGAKLQEIVVSRGKTLELMRPDPNTGKVILVMPGQGSAAVQIFYSDSTSIFMPSYVRRFTRC